MNTRTCITGRSRADTVILAGIVAGLVGCNATTVVDRDPDRPDGGSLDGGSLDSGRPDGGPIVALRTEFARWIDGEGVFNEHFCDCSSSELCGASFVGSRFAFLQCAEARVRDQPALLDELIALSACYGDRFADVAACVDGAGCRGDPVFDMCEAESYCAFPRCERDTSAAMEALLDACSSRLAGAQGGTLGDCS